MPRPLVKNGRPGIGQDIFPESARETGRRIWLYDEEILILEYSTASDGAGSTTPTYTPQAEPVRGRIDPASRAAETRYRGGATAEGGTHIVRFDGGHAISSQDRLLIQGVTWIIIGVRYDTDQLVRTVDVKAI